MTKEKTKKNTIKKEKATNNTDEFSEKKGALAVYNFLENYRTENNLTKKYLAARLNVTEPWLSHLANGKSCVTVDFLLKIEDVTGASLDDILHPNLGNGKTISLPAKTLMGFEGVYELFYSERNIYGDADVLKKALLMIKKNKKTDSSYEVHALFDFIRGERSDEKYANLQKTWKIGPASAKDYFNSCIGNKRYKGTLSLTETNLIFNLCSVSNVDDRVDMTFLRPLDQYKNYTSGLGMMLSYCTSQRDLIPVCQKVGLTRIALSTAKCSDDQIKVHLLFDNYNCNLPKNYSKIDALIDYLYDEQKNGKISEVEYKHKLTWAMSLFMMEEKSATYVVKVDGNADIGWCKFVEKISK